MTMLSMIKMTDMFAGPRAFNICECDFFGVVGECRRENASAVLALFCACAERERLILQTAIADAGVSQDIF